ncbi:hypothetical protein U8326_12430 [Tsuneonella sp. CC-YZS046]|uniref:hypothetical protein n=1 Tax=Tsuneonella sp. CC-YZS046 TaxID=3042152 RepID=UPI002D78CE01|nr:hypothetical protein [Tsuneonella sp. CC-YZS046]WRO65843.1 hypothetical protein U8326_12430 [Tsuneonella sp. CC-YZS046]
MNFRVFPRHMILLGGSLSILALCGAAPARAQTPPAAAVSPALTYADLVDLAEPASLVIKAKIRKQATVEAERSPGLRQGHVRLYIVARVEQPVRGVVASDSLRYLADVPIGQNGKVPKLTGSQVILLARPVPGRPEEIQLVAPDAQLPANGELETRLRSVLQELSAPDRPPSVSGVRDILSVPGNLAGESETQLFLRTSDQDVALISVIRRPGGDPTWGVSWGELVDGVTGPPVRETLAWYRLACFLPPRLPARANLGADQASRALAEEDYRLVRRELGDCGRSRLSQP